MTGAPSRLLAEIDRLQRVEKHAREVMDALEEHGAAIVGHLLDTDDNSGEFLRRALNEPSTVPDQLPDNDESRGHESDS